MSIHDILINLLFAALGAIVGIQISSRDWADLYKRTVEHQMHRHYAVLKFLVARGQCSEQDVLEAEKIYSEGPDVT